MNSISQNIHDHISLMLSAPSTGWKITGTSGASVGGSLLNVLSGGGSIGHVYLRDKENKEHDLDYVAIEGGIGSPDISSPVYLDTGFKELPASAIGKICFTRPWEYGETLILDHLTGMFVEMQYSAHFTTAAASVSVIFMGAPGIIASTAALPMAAIPAAISASKAVGIVSNTSVGIKGVAGAGATLRYGYIADAPMI